MTLFEPDMSTRANRADRPTTDTPRATSINFSLVNPRQAHAEPQLSNHHIYVTLVVSADRLTPSPGKHVQDQHDSANRQIDQTDDQRRISETAGAATAAFELPPSDNGKRNRQRNSKQPTENRQGEGNRCHEVGRSRGHVRIRCRTWHPTGSCRRYRGAGRPRTTSRVPRTKTAGRQQGITHGLLRPVRRPPRRAPRSARSSRTTAI